MTLRNFLITQPRDKDIEVTCLGADWGPVMYSCEYLLVIPRASWIVNCELVKVLHSRNGVIRVVITPPLTFTV